MKKFNLKPTQAQLVFKNTQLLNERPAGMTMEEYRAARKLQTRAIRILFPKQFNPVIARSMQPKQKSKHQLQMLQNAMFLKYGTDITEEAQENKLKVYSPSIFTKVLYKIRSVFGQTTQPK